MNSILYTASFETFLYIVINVIKFLFVPSTQFVKAITMNALSLAIYSTLHPLR